MSGVAVWRVLLRAVLVVVIAAGLVVPDVGRADAQGAVQLATPSVSVALGFVGGEPVPFSWSPVANAVAYQFEASQQLLITNAAGDTFYSRANTIPGTTATMDFYRGSHVCLRVRAKPVNNNGVYSTSEWSPWTCTRSVASSPFWLYALTLNLVAWWTDLLFGPVSNDPRADEIGDRCVAVLGDSSSTVKLCMSEEEFARLADGWIAQGGGSETVWIGGSDDEVVAP